MRLNNFIEKLKNNYITNKVERAKTPNFKSSFVVRRRIVFSGKVQRVGFRYEIYILAERLNLTGWVRNKNYNEVELEIQGEEDKIFFLVSHMKALKRATITHVKIDEIPTVNDEMDFIVRRS
ncbi:MAG: acylphosphatase [Natronincolaceae bacterium]|jgi:acylphosphatase|nr:acylphosphatase [Bacillota bacterium]